MEVSINRDIRDYKVRDVGPFTLPQAACVAGGLINVYTVFQLEKKLFNVETYNGFMVLSIFISAFPWVFFGFIHLCGLTARQFIRTALIEQCLNPQIRVYESDHEFDDVGEDVYEVNIPTYSKEEKEEIKKWKGYP